jgi:hypothetical protein
VLERKGREEKVKEERECTGAPALVVLGFPPNNELTLLADSIAASYPRQDNPLEVRAAIHQDVETEPIPQAVRTQVQQCVAYIRAYAQRYAQNERTAPPARPNGSHRPSPHPHRPSSPQPPKEASKHEILRILTRPPRHPLQQMLRLPGPPQRPQRAQTQEIAEKEARIRRTNLWKQLCPKAYNLTDWSRHALSPVCRHLAKEWWPRWNAEDSGLGIYGSTGQGKTRAMYAILRRLHFAGISCLAVDATAFARAASTWNDNDRHTQQDSRALLRRCIPSGKRQVP